MDSYRPFQIEKRRTSRIPMWVQILLMALSAGLLAFVLNLFVFQSYYVDGESMSPTMHTNDRLIISKIEKSVAQLAREPYIPVRGQIVVIDGQVAPSTAATAPHLIKRVVAIPGDRLVVKNGEVTLFNTQYPSGTDLDELLGLHLDDTFTTAPIDLTIPEKSVFVMGDNRKDGGSYDSRAFGTIGTGYIVGRLWVRILPLDQRRVF